MASSEKRTAANRENARRSTGPKTRAGKDHARRNGISHGLTATDLLLDDEDPVAYRALVDATLADMQPRSEREKLLAEHVANTLWRRQRLYRAEAAFINVRTRALKAGNTEIRNSAEAAAMLLTDPDDASRVRLLLRYITAAERACNRAVSDFFAVRYEMQHARDREIEAQRQAKAAYINAALADFAAEDARERTRLNEVLAEIDAAQPPAGSDDDCASHESCQSENRFAQMPHRPQTAGELPLTDPRCNSGESHIVPAGNTIPAQRSGQCAGIAPETQQPRELGRSTHESPAMIATRRFLADRDRLITQMPTETQE